MSKGVRRYEVRDADDLTHHCGTLEECERYIRNAQSLFGGRFHIAERR